MLAPNGIEPMELRFSRKLPSSVLASISRILSPSRFCFRRRYKQKRSSRSRARPPSTPITIPAMAPPDKPDEDEPLEAPPELVGLLELELPLAVATSEPVDVCAAGKESVVSPEGRGALLAARMRPQLDGMSDDRATW